MRRPQQPAKTNIKLHNGVLIGSYFWFHVWCKSKAMNKMKSDPVLLFLIAASSYLSALTYTAGSLSEQPNNELVSGNTL